MSVGCIRAGFVDEEGWGEFVYGCIDVLATNDSYDINKIDVLSSVFLY